jgi:hypothetical protein
MKTPNQIQPGQPTACCAHIGAPDGANVRASRLKSASAPSTAAPIGRHLDPGFVVSRHRRHHT